MMDCGFYDECCRMYCGHSLWRDTDEDSVYGALCRASVIAAIDWASIECDEAERIARAWAATCAVPAARFACTPIGRGMLERRWAVLHDVA
jgi:hypothetical protein